MTDRAIDQERWALSFLESLIDIDRRRIFTVTIYTIDRNLNFDAPRVAQPDTARDRIVRLDASLDLKWFLEAEWALEAGNMALSGNPKYVSMTSKLI